MRKLKKKNFDKLFKLVFVWLMMIKGKPTKTPTPEEYETDAYRALQKRAYKEAGQFYELGGDGRKKRGSRIDRDFNKAQSDYELALRYSGTGGEKRIKNKLVELGLERKRTLGSLNRMKQALEGKLYTFGAIITLAFALVSVSFSFTGNVVLGLTESNFRWIGLCLFACGLTFTFIYFRKKK
jgi:hypothetical protein